MADTKAIVLQDGNQTTVTSLTDYKGDKKGWQDQNADVLKALKQQHPQGIFALFQPKSVAVFKRPTRSEMNYALSQADKDATLDMFEALANTCFLAGDEEMIKNDQRFFGIVQMFKDVMEGEKTELVNL